MDNNQEIFNYFNESEILLIYNKMIDEEIKSADNSKSLWLHTSKVLFELINKKICEMRIKKDVNYCFQSVLNFEDFHYFLNLKKDYFSKELIDIKNKFLLILPGYTLKNSDIYLEQYGYRYMIIKKILLNNHENIIKIDNIKQNYIKLNNTLSHKKNNVLNKL